MECRCDLNWHALPSAAASPAHLTSQQAGKGLSLRLAVFIRRFPHLQAILLLLLALTAFKFDIR
jgi:hypothetical protein